MERWVAKIITLFLIFIIPLICTMLPYKLASFFEKRGENGKKILSCLMCFGGGVFFATFILHMAPESRDILDKALLKPMNITYPLADLLMAGGFFLVFFIEKFILKCNKRRQKKKALRRKERCLQFNKMKNTNGMRQACAPNNAETQEHTSKTVVDIEDIMVGDPAPRQVESDKESCPLRGTGDCCTEPAEARLQDGPDAYMLPDQEKGEAEIEIENAHQTRSLVLIIALSMHRIFEGMGVGLQSSTHAVWSLFVAIMCHETVIGFALGLQFVNNKFSLRKMIVATVLCSLIMPVGVAIGTLLIETGEGSTQLDIINGSLQAVATGTFIYVTFFEILQEEIDPHDPSLSKLVSVFIGFVVMALLSLVPEQGGAALVHVDGVETNTSLFVATIEPNASLFVATNSP